MRPHLDSNCLQRSFKVLEICCWQMQELVLGLYKKGIVNAQSGLCLSYMYKQFVIQMLFTSIFRNDIWVTVSSVLNVGVSRIHYLRVQIQSVDLEKRARISFCSECDKSFKCYLFLFYLLPSIL